MFLLCIPLFIMQSSALVALRLGMDVTHEVRTDSKAQRLLLPIQLLMIVQLQLMNFQYLKSSIQSFMLLINPITWIDMKHPETDDWVPSMLSGRWKKFVEILVHPSLLAPWPCLAMFLRGAIGYLVSVDSVSIILKCESVSDAIFNSLAITFIADLSKPYWQGVSSCFGLQSIQDFRLHLQKAWDETTGELTGKEKKRLKFSKGIQGLARTCFWLRRGKGFELIEDMTTFIALSFIYVRQLFVVAFALKTGVLPAARDVCTMWRWQEGQSEYMIILAKIFTFIVDNLTLVDARYRLDALIEKEEDEMDNPCETEYRRMLNSDQMELLKEYPWHLGMGIAGIVVVLFGRRLMVGIYTCFGKNAQKCTWCSM